MNQKKGYEPKTHMDSCMFTDRTLCGMQKEKVKKTVSNPAGKNEVTCNLCMAIIESADLRERSGAKGWIGG